MAVIGEQYAGQVTLLDEDERHTMLAEHVAEHILNGESAHPSAGGHIGNDEAEDDDGVVVREHPLIVIRKRQLVEQILYALLEQRLFAKAGDLLMFALLGDIRRYARDRFAQRVNGYGLQHIFRDIRLYRRSSIFEFRITGQHE